MKNNKYIPLRLKATGVALLLLGMLCNTASADYRGYWVDAVHNYQAQAATQESNAYREANYQNDYTNTYVAPTYQATQYQPMPYNGDGYMPMPASDAFEIAQAY